MSADAIAGTTTTDRSLSEPTSRGAAIALIAITALGAATRLFDLTSQSLWMDEVASINNMHHFAKGGLRALAEIDRIAPLHSILLWLASSVAGDGALAMRLPSAIAGIVTVPIVYLLTLRMFASRRTALVAAFLIAVSPYAITYAQEARMYSLLLLCSCALVAFAWPVIDRPLRPGELLFVTLVTLTGYYTHHYMMFVSAALGLFLILNGGLFRRRAWIWAATQVLAFILFLPWISLSAEQLASQTALPKPNFPLWIPYTLYTYVAGLSFGPSIRELQAGNTSAVLAQHGLSIIFATLIATVLCLLGLVRAWQPAYRRAGAWTITWLIVPIGLAILATFATKVQYNVRYAVVSYPPIVLLIALAIAKFDWPTSPNALARSRVLKGLCLAATAGLAALLIVSLHNLYFDARYAKEDARPLARLLQSDSSDRLIVTDNSRIEPILAYYGARLPAESLQVDNLLWARTPTTVLERLSAMKGALPKEIWLIEYRTSTTDPTQDIRRRLDGTAHLISAQEWPGVSLRRYRTQPLNN